MFSFTKLLFCKSVTSMFQLIIKKGRGSPYTTWVLSPELIPV